jgi:ribosome recycling factor
MAKKLKGEATDGNETVKNNIRANEINNDESRVISHEIDKKVAEWINRLVGPGRLWFER